VFFVRTSRYRLCELFGIPLYVDVSFAILLLMFMWGQPLTYGLAGALVLAISVVLHELGHSLTARLFGYQTNDITISLIGGCASLIALPRKAWQELLTAVAGPAVSFALSGAALATLLTVPIENRWLFYVVLDVFALNLMLGTFNLLPGFPMDGGRIFRSLLRSFLSRRSATYVAMVVGRVTAVLLVLGPDVLEQIFGITHFWIIPIGGNFFMRLLIAWMIWKEGYREYVQAQMESSWEYEDLRVRVSPPPYGDGN